MYGLLPLLLTFYISVSVIRCRDTEMDRVCNIIDVVKVGITKDRTPRVFLKVISEEELGIKVFEKYQPFRIFIYQDNDLIYRRKFNPKRKASYISFESNKTLKRGKRSSFYYELDCYGNCGGCSTRDIDIFLPVSIQTSPNPAVTEGPKSSDQTYAYIIIPLLASLIFLTVLVICVVVKRLRRRHHRSEMNSSCLPLYQSMELSPLPKHGLLIFKDTNLKEDIFLQITDHLNEHFDIIMPVYHEMEISENIHDWIEKNIIKPKCRNFLTIINGDDANTDDSRLSPAERAVKNVHNLCPERILILRISYTPDHASVPLGMLSHYAGVTIMSCHTSMLYEGIKKVVSFFGDP